jgi:dephospho-CoA kinase
LFGAHVLRSDNTLQRKKIAQIVFSNRQKLAALMRYSHPLILSEMRRQIKQARPKNGIVVVDLPLLFEDRLEPEFDLVVVVAANQKNVLRRCAEKRAMTRAEILRRIKNQKPLSLKKRRADAVIDNNGAQATTFARVKRLYASLLP